MIIGDFDTRVAAAQLNLIFDIEAIFKRRGQKVAVFEKNGDLLFDQTNYGAFEKYYLVFHSSSFRRISSIIGSFTDGLTLDEIHSRCPDLKKSKTIDILNEAVNLGIIVRKESVYLLSNPIGFGPTFEWYVAAVCIKELSSMAYWGVKVEKLTGDYDVVLVRENQIGYIECKSGNFSNISKNHIKSFLDRERILAPQFSIYLVDGVSKDNLKILVDYALEQKFEYEIEIPGVMNTEVSLEAEEYRHFIRLIPINSFFISVRSSIASALREIYQFLTLVCDRTVPTENKAAKAKFH